MNSSLWTVGKPYPKYKLVDAQDFLEDDDFDWNGYERIYTMTQQERTQTLPTKGTSINYVVSKSDFLLLSFFLRLF